MRWDHLFDDLAGQLEHELHAEERDLHQEEERLRVGRLEFRARLAGVMREVEPENRVVTVRSVHGTARRVRLRSLGRDWLAGDVVDTPGEQHIIPFTAVESVAISAEMTQRSLEPSGGRDDLAARLGLPFLLRDLSRRRASLTVCTVAAELHGTIDRVGRDHLDLAVHEQGIPRRDSAVQEVRLIPLGQVLLVRV